MRSIRRQLTFGLLAGFSLLLGAGGAAIFFSARTMLQEQFTAALRSEALAMAASMEQEGKKIEFAFAEGVKPGKGPAPAEKFYQLWLIDGPLLRRSRSLGTNNLPRDFGSLQEPKWFELELPGSGKARAIGVRFFPELEAGHPLKPGERALEVGLVIAADLGKLERSIQSLGGIVLLGGVLTLLATAGLVALILRRGLAPLDRLAAQAESIDAKSLQIRFLTGDVPLELDPIYHRLNDLLARLERSFDDINEYAAKVAHELRTPLAILRLKVEQADEEIPPDLAEALHEELHQLNYVIEQSLLIARAEQGRLVAQPQAFDLAALVADVVGDFSLLAQEEGRQVRVVSIPVAGVMADQKCVRQIIHNLLTNALKHGQGDIEVKVTSHPTECELSIVNRVRCAAPVARETLGLGLRVVETLLGLHRDVKYERSRDGNDYRVSLLFPVASLKVGASVPPPSSFTA